MDAAAARATCRRYNPGRLLCTFPPIRTSMLAATSSSPGAAFTAPFPESVASLWHELMLSASNVGTWLIEALWKQQKAEAPSGGDAAPGGSQTQAVTFPPLAGGHRHCLIPVPTPPWPGAPLAFGDRLDERPIRAIAPVHGPPRAAQSWRMLPSPTRAAAWPSGWRATWPISTPPLPSTTARRETIRDGKPASETNLLKHEALWLPLIALSSQWQDLRERGPLGSLFTASQHAWACKTVLSLAQGEG